MYSHIRQYLENKFKERKKLQLRKGMRKRLNKE